MSLEESKLHYSVENSPLSVMWEINYLHEETDRATDLTKYFFLMMGINRF
jgi:hypothetical protein